MNTTSQPADAPLDAEQATDTQAGVDKPADAQTGREAARYRRQLRDVEQERDMLTSRLDAAHRQIVESIAGSILDKPSALWKADVELSDLLDDDGNVDADKVTAAATTAHDELGLMTRRNGPIIPNQGTMPEHGPDLTPTWESAFSPD